MIGTKLYKSKSADMAKYSDCAVWCNQNNAHIEDCGEYYEVVDNVTPEPSKEEKIAVLDAEFTQAQNEYVNSIGVARLTNDTELEAELQAEYAEIVEDYKEQRRELEEDGID